jgi:hypothetical protein
VFACPRLIALSHASPLGQEVCEDANIGQDNEQDYPTYLAESGHIVATEKVAHDNDEQPEPQDKHEHGEHVRQEIGKCETTLKQHDRSPFPGSRACLKTTNWIQARRISFVIEARDL